MCIRPHYRLRFQSSANYMYDLADLGVFCEVSSITDVKIGCNFTIPNLSTVLDTATVGSFIPSATSDHCRRCRCHLTITITIIITSSKNNNNNKTPSPSYETFHQFLNVPQFHKLVLIINCNFSTLFTCFCTVQKQKSNHISETTCTTLQQLFTILSVPKTLKTNYLQMTIFNFFFSAVSQWRSQNFEVNENYV